MCFDTFQKYLVEQDYQFAYADSGRDLLSEKSKESGSGVYVFAGPNYDLAADTYAFTHGDELLHRSAQDALVAGMLARFRVENARSDRAALAVG